MTIRAEHRVPVDVPVKVSSIHSGEKVPGIATDISLGGMFIETAFPASFGDAVLVALTPPGHRAPMILTGTVRWTKKSGMGIQFGALGARETYAITEIARQGRVAVESRSI